MKFESLPRVFLWIGLLILVTEIDGIRSEVFSSMDELIKLPASELKVVEHMRQIVRNQYAKLKEAERTLEMFELMAKESTVEPKKFMGNPVNSFLMVRTLTQDLEKFFTVLNNSQELSDVRKQIDEKVEPMPNHKDLEGSAVALHRIEDVYKLPPDVIQKGKFGSSQSIRPLNALECFEIGRFAQLREDHYHAIHWFNESLVQAQIEGSNATVDTILVGGHMTFSSFKRGNVYHAVQEAKRLLELDPNNEQIKRDLEAYKLGLGEKIALKVEENPDLNSLDLTDLYEYRNERPDFKKYSPEAEYEALCRDDFAHIMFLGTEQLTCSYASHHPYLVIGPVKRELVYDDPPVWVFYDVVTETQAERMMEISRSKLKRAEVELEEGSGVSDVRVSQNKWLIDGDLPFLPRLAHLISALTNLSMETSEEWQMNNYGLGGYYGVHTDYFEDNTVELNETMELGNRIATWMFYLEGPEMGGATVFPDMGARVNPVSRSAVFWYNLLPDGKGDGRTLHAACPVLVGSKWVTNKWIRANGQMFRRPCPKPEEESTGSCSAGLNLDFDSFLSSL